MQYFSRESIGSMEGDLHQLAQLLAGVAKAQTVVPVVRRPQCSTTPSLSPPQASCSVVWPPLSTIWGPVRELIRQITSVQSQRGALTCCRKTECSKRRPTDSAREGISGCLRISRKSPAWDDDFLVFHGIPACSA
jgi:hypothetical protein